MDEPPPVARPLDPLTQLFFLPAMLAMTRQSFLLRIPPAATFRRALMTTMAVFGAASLAACGGSDGPTAPPGGGGGGGVASVTVSPNTATVAIGATTTLTATPVDASGSTVSGQAVTWSTGDASIATVTGGVVTGKATGTVTITAAAGGHQGQATITVGPAAVASVTLATSQTSLLSYVADTAGLGRAQVTATAKDASGNVLSGRTFTYTSSDTTLAVVNASGVVTAVGPSVAGLSKTVTITAASGGQSGSVTITVTKPRVTTVALSPSSATIHVGGSQVFNATLTDAQGHVLVNRIVTVIVNPSSVAAPDPMASNQIDGKAAGSATVAFSTFEEGTTGTASLTVVP